MMSRKADESVSSYSSVLKGEVDERLTTWDQAE